MYVNPSGRPIRRCWFACDCGNRTLKTLTKVMTGWTTSCGCFNTEGTVARCTTHGMRKTTEYGSYYAAKVRCQWLKHEHYNKYGGRGIEFRFRSFEEFFACLGKKPTKKHSVDRIDNDGHYEPGNVRWATKKKQSQNTRSPREMYLWSFILLVRTDIFSRCLNYMSPLSCNERVSPVPSP